MFEFYLGLGILVVIVIAIIIIIELNKQKFVRAIEHQLKHHGKLEHSKLNSHQYVLTTKDRTILIRLIYAPSVNEVSFNSKRHWQLFSSSGKKMIETHGFQEIQGEKLLLIYPQPGKIVKYINENEVVFVKPEMDVFGMHAIHINQIDEYFK
jgi:2-polyprenyl-3-methyl-5-hydroxy-6-metoxy-1,4-benzoquinol methylase